MITQPEALRLADKLNGAIYADHLDAMAADELRRQHTEIERLTAERDALARCKLADQDAYVAMRDQRDAALADAKRYRWLRTYKPVSLLKLAPTQEPYLNAVDVVDAAIDKAMVEQP